MIIYGTRMYGKVDKVPGLGHVATRFVHIDFVPLVPTASFMILAQSGGKFRGVPIPLSFKSVLMTWLRAAAAVAGIGGVIMLVIGLLDNSSDRTGLLVSGLILGGVGWGLFAFSVTHRTATRASFRRACELGRLIKLNSTGMDALASAYGEAPITHGFEPIPLQASKPPAIPRVLPVQPLPVEEQTSSPSPEISVPMLEVIDADGEDGDNEPGELAAERAEAPAVAAAVTPLKGY